MGEIKLVCVGGAIDVLVGEKPCTIRERGRERCSRLLSLYGLSHPLPYTSFISINGGHLDW